MNLRKDGGRIFAVTWTVVLLMISLVSSEHFSTMAQSLNNSIYVDDDNTAGPWDGTPEHPYQNITSALEHALAGDALHVNNGTYYESIIVNKTVSLFGENVETTVIDGGGVGNVTEVTVDNVTITGFTIRNGRKEWPNSGITLKNVKNCNVSGNSIKNNWFGIQISNTSSHNTISENSITNNEHGIVIYSSSKNTISGNNITTKDGFGIMLQLSSNNTISRNNITNNWAGIELDFCSDYNIISGNNITANNRDGIGFDHSSNNAISGNNITANIEYGIRISGTSTHNNIFRNNIAYNLNGIRLSDSSNNNSIFHNKFVGNQQHASTYTSPNNSWNDDYPSGGNYWSNYTGVDEKSGSDQDEVGSDGIGDTSHEIDEYNLDRYPLMGSINTFDAGIWDDASYSVDIISNSTVSKFRVNKTEKTIIFNVTGSDFTLGFCRVTIPNTIVQDLWQGSYTVLVNEQSVEFRSWSDTRNTYIHFAYQHSEHQVTMIPEFPSAIIMLFIVLTLLAVSFKKCQLKESFEEDSNKQGDAVLLKLHSHPYN